jgi:hypothetical protein
LGAVDLRKNQEVKLFIVLLICTAFIFSSAHYGKTAYMAITANTTGFSKGTMIGVVDVSGKSKDEAVALLNTSLEKWRQGTSITLQYKEKSVPVDIGQFSFDLENSAAMAKDGQKNEVTVTFKSGDLYQYLKEISQNLDSSKIEMDPLQAELTTYASNLSPGQYTVKVEKYVDQSSNNQVISEQSIKPETVPLDLGVLAEKLSPIKIEAKSKFSLLKLMEEHQLTEYSSDAASMIATVVYKSILNSNFAIVEKHTGQALPDYIEIGYEAKVNYKNHLDFIFVNPNESNFEIELRAEGNTLTATLKGSPFLNKYTPKLGEIEGFEPKTIIQYAPKPTVRVLEKGQKGQMVKVYREVHGENGEFTKKELISEDFYPPVHRIEVHALGSGVPADKTDSGTKTEGTNGTSETDGASGTNGTAGSAKDENKQQPSDDDLFGKPNETLK